jgi:hypothetical protein
MHEVLEHWQSFVTNTREKAGHERDEALREHDEAIVSAGHAVNSAALHNSRKGALIALHLALAESYRKAADIAEKRMNDYVKSTRRTRLKGARLKADNELTIGDL